MGPCHPPIGTVLSVWGAPEETGAYKGVLPHYPSGKGIQFLSAFPPQPWSVPRVLISKMGTKAPPSQ